MHGVYFVFCTQMLENPISSC